MEGRPVDRRTRSRRRRIVRWARRRPGLARSLGAGVLAGLVLFGAGVAWTLSLRRLNEQITRQQSQTDHLNYVIPLKDFNEFPISPDGRNCIAVHADHGIGLFDMKTGALRVRLADAAACQKPTLARFSPDGRRVAVYGDADHRLMIWETASGTLRHRSDVLPLPLTSIALQPNGEALMTAASSLEVRLGDPSKNLDVQVHPPHPAGLHSDRIDFTPDGVGFLVRRIQGVDADRVESRSSLDGKLRAESPVHEAGTIQEWTVLDECTKASSPSSTRKPRRSRT